ncbi:hypothetical protein MKS88_001781 [Plasmodium brasilianum]|uniref:Uncharacterized protein n=1 Tax=Plasmodium brasilianum TaxID=5824 RepID=A0ACB9YD87_PLABR|nr:hypothetical protein MKS88_001781 [Plasmodium brasilianum]
MEGCASRNYSGLGFGATQYLGKLEFRQTKNQILSRLSSLGKKTIKEEFRKECLELTNFLIKKKDEYPKYTDRNRWVPVLRNYFEGAFNRITQHGGCPMIFDEKEKDLLELKYNALDFCEKNISYKNKLNTFKKGSNTYDCNNDTQCIIYCKEYEEWFVSKKQHFEKKRHLIHESCTFKKSSSQFPARNCNILDSRTFNKLPQCLLTKPDAPSQAPTEQKEINRTEVDQLISKDVLTSQNQSLSQVERPPDNQHSPSERQPSSLPEDPPSDQTQLQETPEESSMENLTNLGVDTQSSITKKPDSLTPSSSPQKTLGTSSLQHLTGQESSTDSAIGTISAAAEVLHPKPLPTTVDSKIQGSINSTFFPIFVLTKQINIYI